MASCADIVFLIVIDLIMQVILAGLGELSYLDRRLFGETRQASHRATLKDIRSQSR